MRFLYPARAEQLRLGWLAVLVNLIQDQRRSLDVLEADLRNIESRFSAWWEGSGLTEPPKGMVQQTRRRQTVRMLVAYGLYDEEQERLTDLGLLLQVIRPNVLKENKNPFVWTDGDRWIGLYLCVHVAGDVLISALRQWNAATLGLKEAADLLNSVLLQLSSTTRDNEMAARLHQQAGRVQQDNAPKNLVYPYLEPLRELRFLTILRQGPKERVYALTEAGLCLRARLLEDQRSADEWLQEGLSRAFLEADAPGHSMHPATASDLGEALHRIPSQLTRASGQEVSLSTAVAYTQALLLRQKPGTWIDQALTVQLMEEITRRSGAGISFKRGLSVGETHISWSEPSLLEDPSIWGGRCPEVILCSRALRLKWILTALSGSRLTALRDSLPFPLSRALQNRQYWPSIPQRKKAQSRQSPRAPRPKKSPPQ